MVIHHIFHIPFKVDRNQTLTIACALQGMQHNECLTIYYGY
jgi:hypothetical protein